MNDPDSRAPGCSTPRRGRPLLPRESADPPVADAPGRPPGPRATPSEWVFLLLATAVVVVPAWLPGNSGSGLKVETGSLETPAIDIRTAPWYVWTLLEGIGEARASRIVQFREERGGFRALADLAEIPGMPRGWLEKARPYLYCGEDHGRGDGESISGGQ